MEWPSGSDSLVSAWWDGRGNTRERLFIQTENPTVWRVSYCALMMSNKKMYTRWGSLDFNNVNLFFFFFLLSTSLFLYFPRSFCPLHQMASAEDDWRLSLKSRCSPRLFTGTSSLFLELLWRSWSSSRRCWKKIPNEKDSQERLEGASVYLDVQKGNGEQVPMESNMAGSSWSFAPSCIGQGSFFLSTLEFLGKEKIEMKERLLHRQIEEPIKRKGSFSAEVERRATFFDPKSERRLREMSFWGNSKDRFADSENERKSTWNRRWVGYR